MEKHDNKKENKSKVYRRHLIPCSNCGKDILDHMTQCPFCKAELTPKYYKPMDPVKVKKIKLILAVIGCIVAVILLFIAK